MRDHIENFENFPRLASDKKLATAIGQRKDWSQADLTPIEFASHPETQTALEITPQNSFGEFAAMVRQFESDSNDLKLEKKGTDIESRRICTLELQAASQLGFGGLVSTPVKVGSWMTVYFPADKALPAYDVTGKVTSCEPDSDNPSFFKVDVNFGSTQKNTSNLPQLKLAQ